MSFMSWVGLFLCFTGLAILIPRGEKGELRETPLHPNHHSERSTPPHSSKNREERIDRASDRSMATNTRRFDKDEIFSPSDFMDNGILDPLYIEWRAIKDHYLSNMSQGLNFNHPIMIEIGERGIETADKLAKSIAKKKATRMQLRSDSRRR